MERERGEENGCYWRLKWETNAENRINNRVIKQTPKRRSFGNKERKNKKAITKGEENDWRGKGEKRTAAIEDWSERQMLKIGLIGL